MLNRIPPTFHNQLKNKFAIVINLAIAAISLIAMASLFSKNSDWCELLSHLRLVLIGALAGLIAASVCLRQKFGLIGLVVLFLLAVPVADLFIKPAPPNEKDLSKITLLEMNLWGGKNHDYDRAVALIKRENADVVGLSEITGSWLAELKQRLPQYQYVVAEPQLGGIAVFSRLPMKGTIKYFGKIRRPRIEAQIDLNNQNITLIFAHPVIPLRVAEIRNAEFVQLASDASAHKRPVILAGDLNCTPWSYYFTNLLSAASLNDTEKGFGPQCSWSAFALPVFPIDHCLVSSDFVTLNRRLLEPFGSDHIPFIVELGLPSSRPDDNQ